MCSSSSSRISSMKRNGGRWGMAASTAAGVSGSPVMAPPAPAGRPGRVVGIHEVAKQAGACPLERVDWRTVNQHGGVPEGQRGAGVGEGGAPPHVDLVAHRPIVRADLALERDLAAAERTAGAEAATPGAEEADQLPHRVRAEAARLHGVAEEMTLEEPVVEVHVAFGGDTAAAAVAAELDDAVDHEERGKGEARLEARGGILDEPAVCEGEQLSLGEARLRLELGVGHAAASKRTR